MDYSKFKHSTKVRVRNYEVDWQGVVHNANYLLYFEVGRVEYLKHLGIKIDLSTIMNENRVVLVRNEINYRSSAYFDELLSIFTRITYIKNTSFAFEGYIQEATKKRMIADNVAIHVWLHPQTGEPITVNRDFLEVVKKYEGKHIIRLIHRC